MSFTMPKKRYILIATAFAYLIAKVYVLQTPSPNDDTIPDKVRTIVLQLLAVNPDDTDNPQG